MQQRNLQDCNTQCEHLKEKLAQQELEIQKSKDELNSNISSLTNTVELLLSEIENMKKHMEMTNAELIELSNAVKKRPTQHDLPTPDLSTTFEINELKQKTSTLELKQQLSENTSYNGRMLWKIDSLTYRMQQAVTGKVTALHSAPCFTSRYGYKFCGRLYPNGDGMGRCSHLSLFMVVMKSEYDNLLEWPFNKHVMFKLINQKDYSKSIEESFLPDGASSSFRKPTKEMNVAAGCPLFLSKEKLLNEGFIKDDSIFIEISAK